VTRVQGRAARPPHLRHLLVLALAGCGGPTPAVPAAPRALPPTPPGVLRAPGDFADVADRRERSQALFLEAAKVLFHPRCQNCHPSGDTPTQREELGLHDPPVTRGPEDRGVPGLYCDSCHQDANGLLARVPGAPHWRLAPRSAAWVGVSARAVCEQLKDPARNGSRSLDQIVDHVSHDALVAWGWTPGADRPPAPGTQERFGALVAAWIRDGAECPPEGAKP
jgi:hypothetical protein